MTWPLAAQAKLKSKQGEPGVLRRKACPEEPRKIFFCTYLQRPHTCNWRECSWALVTFQYPLLPTAVPFGSQATCLAWHQPEIPAAQPRIMEVHTSQVTSEPGEWSQFQYFSWEPRQKAAAQITSSTSSSSKTSPLSAKGHLHCQETDWKAKRKIQTKEATSIIKALYFFLGNFKLSELQGPRGFFWLRFPSLCHSVTLSLLQSS